MDRIYQEYWDNLRVEKQAFWGMGNETTKELPIIYPVEPDPLIGLLPTEIMVANEVIEEANYFIFNGKKKVRKIPFLSQLLPKNNLKNIQSTSGHLFLTIDPEWILRCSDKQYTSWQSCFAPDGCYHFSAKEYTTSINIAMAMITNSDMTKMIGRRFVIIPSSNGNRNTREEIVFFAKHYGTFPIHYQRSLSAYIAESVFSSNKDNWKSISNEEDCHAEEAEIYVEGVDNVGNSRFMSKGSKSIWFDDSAFVLRKKGSDIENAYISFDSDEEDSEENSEEADCEHCQDRYNLDDLWRVYYDDYSDYCLICPSCLDDIAVMDNVTGDYIYSDEAVEYWYVDSRGNADHTRYTTNEYASSNLFEIHVIGGIGNDNKLQEDDLLYADGIPNSCVEYNGEYLCVDIEDTDNSAIIELIKELEGEDDEDEEEPEEVATEALEEQRTTDS